MGRNRISKEPRAKIAVIEGYNENRLINIPVPEKTESYTPIPHKMIIGTIQDQIKKRGMVISNTDYRTGFDGNRVIGFYKITPKEEQGKKYGVDDLIRTVAFRNSYDKSMSFGVGVGATVWICSNGMFSADMTFVKKHMGDLDEIVEDQIIGMFGSLENEFEKLTKFRRALREIEISKRLQAELLGRMVFEENLLSSTQIQVVRMHRDHSEQFSGDTAWDLYNNITEALKKTNVVHFYKKHQNATKFFQEEIVGAI